MLTLILADNFLLMFLGWEGVGLCSYLLIGFWYDRKFEQGTTGDAAKKAFVVNRVGDFGFLVGMFLIYVTFGSLKFQTVFASAATLAVGAPIAMWITLALFLGATGKSAQIPLFVWLPDAMAGPTPVSALIHAATMVTAGVYMVARCSVLFALAPVTMQVVAVTGALTALFAATIGLVQNDIKKVLAYSTISQLGYMFLALGVGAFTAGIFHVMTHAFFKALLFLGSGAVIHAMHDEQDIRKMGGLKSALPTTYRTFLVGTVAIAGIPPLAGFFSKDEILWKAFSGGHVILWVMGLLGAGLTAFYMFRLLSLTFEGEKRWDAGKHPHEAPASMTIPLMVLALLSIVGGFLGVLLMVVSVAVAIAGIFLARSWYLRAKRTPDRLAEAVPGAYALLVNKYYVDELYDKAIVSPLVSGSDKLLWKIVDVGIIDRLVNALARAIAAVSRTVRVVQTGVAHNYMLVFLAGVVAIIGWLLAK
jgi:NADH-quinone oxidoreductase subunit L